MEHSIVGSNITWTRCALCAALVLLSLWLSGCADDKKTDSPPTNTFDLTVSLTGSGQVASSPAGIDCGSDCAETLAAESSITLSATPASGAMFTGWSGDCSGNTSSCTITMSASRAVTAAFTFTTNPPPPATQYTLTVNVTGSGSVGSSPVGIDCGSGSDCTETLAAGSSITLSATPASGAMFTGWSGDCSGNTSSCTITMSASRAVTAAFTFTTNPPPPATQYTLTVNVTGSGSVGSSPVGIDCGSGSDCTETLAAGSSITLSATPASGYTFTGWSGSGISCPGTGTCTVSMTAARSVTATFSQIAATNYALTVSLAGSGSVSSSPAGINCGTDCAENYAAGTSVILTATSGIGSTFSGWSGSGISCPGTGTCTVSMTAARSVTATFTTSASISISITAPVSTGSYTATSTPLTVGGTTTGSVSQVTWVNGSSNGIATGTGTWSAAGIALQAGTNTITVTAHASGGGSTASASLVVTYGTATSSTFYLSPSGLNTNNGTSITTPWKTFAHAFSSTGMNMKAGDELILLNGLYSAAASIGTGVISYLGAGSGQPPSGTGVNNVTRVRALNPGSVTIAGGLFLGRSNRKDSYITIQGITFDGNSNGGESGGGSLYNTDHVTVKESGFRGGLGIGTNDSNGTIVNTYALLEDVWVWGTDTRIMLSVYRSDHVVVRRAVVRNDGCFLTAPNTCGGNRGNAMVGTTIYNSHDVSFQNVIAVDNLLGTGGWGGASDFSIAWHNNHPHPFYRNEWLGTLSINTGLGMGYYYDIDNLVTNVQPMATYRDIVAINTQSGSTSSGLSLNINCGAGCPAHDISIRNATLRTIGGGIDPPFGIYINPALANGVLDIQNIIAFGDGATSTGVNTSSPVSLSYMNVYGYTVPYSKPRCVTGCYTVNPTGGATPSLKYPIQIENGSPLKNAGLNGADIGATVLNRYGADGTRYGDANYNTLTSTPLWPWPNEARIKQQMCAGGEERGFCSIGKRLDGINPVTLTTYIWEQLGSPIPSGIYPPP